MSSWTIERVKREQDLEGILEVERASFASPWTRDMYRWELQHSGVSHLYVLRITNEAVAGFCSFWLIFEELHINNLAVRPEDRRRGFGTALLLHSLKEGADLGARRATLEVRESNEAARRLYERMGFVVMGVRRHYYTGPVENAIVLGRHDLVAGFQPHRSA